MVGWLVGSFYPLLFLYRFFCVTYFLVFAPFAWNYQTAKNEKEKAGGGGGGSNKLLVNGVWALNQCISSRLVSPGFFMFFSYSFFCPKNIYI